MNVVAQIPDKKRSAPTNRIVRTIAGAVVWFPACCHSTPATYTPTTPVPSKLLETGWVFTRGRANPQNASEDQMITNGFAIANTVLLSNCFQQGVVEAALLETNGQTPQSVYAIMALGPPQALDIILYDGGDKHGTVGWDSPEEPAVVHMNRYYVKSSYILASNLLHEAAHARGFRHCSAGDAASVPYTMNYIFDRCARAFGPEGSPPLGDAEE